ncbi:hypothetical protein BX666DRAFT_304754 [Dichotomocladium elegans]|nr:hypothetical protein BX666DRAFT_304754 [Dichotomocladium elegans]
MYAGLEYAGLLFIFALLSSRPLSSFLLVQYQPQQQHSTAQRSRSVHRLFFLCIYISQLLSPTLALPLNQAGLA